MPGEDAESSMSDLDMSRGKEGRQHEHPVLNTVIVVVRKYAKFYANFTMLRDFSVSLSPADALTLEKDTRFTGFPDPVSPVWGAPRMNQYLRPAGLQKETAVKKG